MFRWSVMHLCERQLRDINPSDVLNNGLYRRCDTYKGGGGYDKFEEIYKRRIKDGAYHEQFVVQVRGCPLKCPYCYVTDEGVNSGVCSQITTEQLVNDFCASGLPVFHLMGGAPALYIDQWHEILDVLPNDKVFHSDLLLLEGVYDRGVIEKLSKDTRSLYAVSIKGGTSEEFRRNTGVSFDEDLFWRNFDTIVSCGLPFYITWTGMSNETIALSKRKLVERYGESVLADSFAIQLIAYEALK